MYILVSKYPSPIKKLPQLNFDQCTDTISLTFFTIIAEPITSVQQTRDGNAVLVSTLDSTVRLMDKGNGQLLQSYKGHVNTDFRIRSCLGMADTVVISGSEDGHLLAWDLLKGTVIAKLAAHDGKVASAVAFNKARMEWASAGVNGQIPPHSPLPFFCGVLGR